jgi:hypothetical protein
MDFIVNGQASGRMVRTLSVVDACTRERLALEADTSPGSGRVTRVLERSIDERGPDPSSLAYTQLVCVLNTEHSLREPYDQAHQEPGRSSAARGTAGSTPARVVTP